MGDTSFAECLRHSAKQHKHSAKPLPSVALGKEGTAKKGSAKTSLPSVFCRALGKDFAECFLSGTRQRLCRVPNRALGKKNGRDGGRNGDGRLPSVTPRGTRQRAHTLPSVTQAALGKDSAFAECHSTSTRQRAHTLPSAAWLTLGKVCALPSAALSDTRQNLGNLPSATLGKGIIFFLKRLFSLPPRLGSSHNSFICLQ
jgi:hypothetical protein